MTRFDLVFSCVICHFERQRLDLWQYRQDNNILPVCHPRRRARACDVGGNETVQYPSRGAKQKEVCHEAQEACEDYQNRNGDSEQHQNYCQRARRIGRGVGPVRGLQRVDLVGAEKADNLPCSNRDDRETYRAEQWGIDTAEQAVDAGYQIADRR